MKEAVAQMRTKGGVEMQMLKVEFKEDVYAVAYGLTQYDFGQKMEIRGLQVQEPTIEVHFAQGGNEALRQIGAVKDGTIFVDIPDVLLLSSDRIKAYVYRTTETEGETIRTISMPVKRREKPVDFQNVEIKNALHQVLEIAQSVRNDADTGVFDGKSAYEIAKNLGFAGTEQEWIDSLRYDHSEEFAILAEQVENNKEQVDEIAKQFAETAQNAMQNVKQTGELQREQMAEECKNAILEVQKEQQAAGKFIDSKKEEAVNAIQKESAEQSELLIAEGGKQVQLVQDEAQKISNDREQIQKNTEEIGSLYGQISGMASAVVETVDGDAMLTACSTRRPLKGLNLYGKSTQTTTTGAQLFDKEKRVSGKVIDSTNGNVAVNDRYACSDFIEIPQGTKNLYQTNGAINQRAFYDENKSFIGKPNNNNTVVPENAKYIRISSTIDMQDMSDIMLNVGETAKPYEPYTGGKPSPSIEYPQAVENAGDSGQIKVELYGKNLIPFPYHDFGNETVAQKNGVTYTLQADGAIKANGTITDQFGINIALKRFSEKPLNGNPGGTNTDGYVVMCREPMYFDPKNNKTFILFDGNDVGKPINTVIYPQIEVGTIPTAYEQYKTPQELTTPTPNGLRGIPVSSGGNYTDENGQQWICDEIDLAKGKYIKRINSVTIDGNDLKFSDDGNGFWNTKFFSAVNGIEKENVNMSEYFRKEAFSLNEPYKFIFTTAKKMKDYFQTAEDLNEFCVRKYSEGRPLKILYVQTPIETDLPTEVIEQYKKLHTNYPTTTVLNDAGVWMELQYVSDTKHYIDKKFAELQKALINTNTQLLQGI